jgi:hypothetical protein
VPSALKGSDLAVYRTVTGLGLNARLLPLINTPGQQIEGYYEGYYSGEEYDEESDYAMRRNPPPSPPATLTGETQLLEYFMVMCSVNLHFTGAPNAVQACPVL